MGTTPRLTTSLLLASPAIVLTFAALVLLAVTPFTWGVAAHVDMPDWLITACALIVAVPVLYVGVSTTWRILRYTTRPFHVFWVHLPFLVAMPAAALVVVLLAGFISNPRTYDNLAREETRTTPEAVIGITLILSPFGIGGLWACSYMYAEAFSEQRAPYRAPDERWFTD